MSGPYREPPPPCTHPRYLECSLGGCCRSCVDCGADYPAERVHAAKEVLCRIGIAATFLLFVLALIIVLDTLVEFVVFL